MKLDYVDLFYTHRFDPQTPLEETLRALVDAVRAGKALYVGISRYPLDAARFAFRYLVERDVPCLLFQDRYNLLDREPEREGLLSAAAGAGSGFIAFSPLAQGLLTDRYLGGVPADSRMARAGSLGREVLTKELLGRLRGLNELDDERASSVIVGASSVEQLADNLRALQSPGFSDEELRRIDDLSAGAGR